MAPAVGAAMVSGPATPSDLDLVEMDQIGEGGEALSDLTQVEAAEPVEAEILDGKGRQHRAEQHRENQDPRERREEAEDAEERADDAAITAPGGVVGRALLPRESRCTCANSAAFRRSIRLPPRWVARTWRMPIASRMNAMMIIHQ